MAANKDIIDSTGASKRKVKAVEQAFEYPNEVEACVVAKKQPARKAKKQPPAAAKDAAKVATSTSSNLIEQDRTLIDARAQEKAARQMITENELIAYYLATGNFTIPELKEQVENSKKLVSNFFKQHYNIDTYLSYLDPMGTRNISVSDYLLKFSHIQPDKLDADESSD